VVVVSSLRAANARCCIVTGVVVATSSSSITTTTTTTAATAVVAVVIVVVVITEHGVQVSGQLNSPRRRPLPRRAHSLQQCGERGATDSVGSEHWPVLLDCYDVGVLTQQQQP
jgi:hypothetical protein